MEITWRTPAEYLLDDVELERVNSVATFLKLNRAIAIDSYTMSSDGPTLASIFLVSGGYLVEVKLTSKYKIFDLSAAKTIQNYRVTYGASAYDKDSTGNNDPEISNPSSLLEVSSQGDDKVTSASNPVNPTSEPKGEIKFVKIDLLHTDRLSSELSYFGEDFEDWLSYVFEAYPKDFLLSP